MKFALLAGALALGTVSLAGCAHAAEMPHASAAPTIAPPAPPRPCACGPHPAAPAPIPASPDLSTIEGLQRALVALGARIDVDGDFGPQTEAAVKAFQAHSGLVADGDAGPMTKAALFHHVV